MIEVVYDSALRRSARRGDMHIKSPKDTLKCPRCYERSPYEDYDFEFLRLDGERCKFHFEQTCPACGYFWDTSLVNHQLVVTFTVRR